MGGVSLAAGDVIWCELDPSVGREQGGRRPCLVISSIDFGAATDELVIVVPCTTRERQWISRVTLAGETGLNQPTFAITEQPRTISTDRVHGRAGSVDSDCLAEITRWVAAWLHTAA